MLYLRPYMANYELTVILSGKTTLAKKKSTIGKIEKLIDTLKGKVVKSDEWGEIELATKIEGTSAGNFLFFILELASDAIKKLDDKLKLEDEIVRFLLVKKEKE